MGRMLKALQQVGTTPRSAHGSGPVARQERESFGFVRNVEPRHDELAQPRRAEFIPPRPNEFRPVTSPPEYQALSDRVLFQVSSQPSAAIVFASVAPQGSAAAVIADLAVAIAGRISDEVLLIDADFHRPRLADRFGVNAKRSFPEVILGAIPWEQAVRQTPTPRLSLLPGGQWTAGADLPEGFAPERLLSSIRQSYRLVLIHTVDITRWETVWLGRHADGIQLIIDLGRTPRRAARQAVGRLGRQGVRPLGCIVAERSVNPESPSSCRLSPMLHWGLCPR